MNINPRAQVRLESPHGIPVLYIEEFYSDPDAVRAAALDADFRVALARYPGRTAPIDPDSIREILETIASIANRVCDRLVRAADILSDFSIVTVHPKDFVASQRCPHLDPWPLFGLVYLTPGSHEGTSLYFSEQLGYAVARTDEQRRRHEELIAAADRGEMPIQTGGPAWRKLHTIDPHYNRFVMFPGNVLHAMDIVSVSDHDRGAARLTQRFIVARTYPQMRAHPSSP